MRIFLLITILLISSSCKNDIYTGEIVKVNGGSFNIGETTNNQIPQTIIVADFSISKYEITNSQYATFMNAINANEDGSDWWGTLYLEMESRFCQISYTNGVFKAKKGKENYPVTTVTWCGARAYAKHYGGRLPTEIEWEFAARGGNSSNKTKYSGSNFVDEVAWHNDNSKIKDSLSKYNNYGTSPVGLKKANELGIFDMSGNVREWTNDIYHSDYYGSSPNNNSNRNSKEYKGRVVRGGSCYTEPENCRIAYRECFNKAPFNNFDDLGFRPVFNP